MSVKDLRERTQAGFLDCKKALDEANGDMEKAVELLRAKGLAKANKRAGMDALDGGVIIKQVGSAFGMLFFGAETDFVAKSDEFCNFANDELALFLNAYNNEAIEKSAREDITQLSKGDDSFANRVAQLSAKVGENVMLKGQCVMQSDAAGEVAFYLHNKLSDKFDNVARIGVLLKAKGASPDIAKQLCMHIASFKPVAINESSMSAEQKALVSEDRKLKDLVLDMQSYLMDPSKTVSAFCKDSGIEIVDFAVFSVK